eukprot:CAMPEP_0170517562 /NCGR_PEP_ID=MMETSP0209-20121228/3509_1 /TAXON_ID=665100 ORGANISM="Litonotus pictus, Strain P1" /NCGR_SAMPLE_ID=MMETSP0209 /ASSEMBLY_ACC=CAM_ASM_000301 /LENGTH=104 /DNA_ID=CAMNT_0010802841 /DNA_START=1230 /DNA_END=1544 /DNA_ORIENTATION=-
MIYICLISSLLAAPHTLIPAGIQEVFGVKYAGEVYGGSFYAFGVGGFLAPIISKALDLSDATTTTPYLIIYLVGGGMGVIAIVLTIFLDMTPYEYEYYEEEEEK